MRSSGRALAAPRDEVSATQRRGTKPNRRHERMIVGRGGDHNKELRSPPGRREQGSAAEARKTLAGEQGSEALIKTHFD